MDVYDGLPNIHNENQCNNNETWDHFAGSQWMISKIPVCDKNPPTSNENNVGTSLVDVYDGLPNIHNENQCNNNETWDHFAGSQWMFIMHYGLFIWIRMDGDKPRTCEEYNII